MKSSGRKISFLATEKEMKLLWQACEFGADADRNLERADAETGQWRLSFSYEELDDLTGHVMECLKYEDSKEKRDEIEEFLGKIKSLLHASDYLRGKSLDGLIKTYNTQASATPKRPTLKHFIFKVSVTNRTGEKAVRTIQIAETKSLYNFAKAITQAFDFYFDHCFGFYERREGHFFGGRAFELFVDVGEEPTVSGAKGVKKVKVKQAFKAPGDTMIFLSDYGDSWQFDVELHEVGGAGTWDLKPATLEKIGAAPAQYPPCDEGRWFGETSDQD